jgi:hypothetical protein
MFLRNGARISSPGEFSGHSLRRGFANWATSNGWDLKTLMQYVGWRDVQSAMRYLDATDRFEVCASRGRQGKSMFACVPRRGALQHRGDFDGFGLDELPQITSGLGNYRKNAKFLVILHLPTVSSGDNLMT